MLCLDVWRRVVPRLDLQAAREMQEVVAGVVEEAVASLVAHVLATPPPAPVADLLREFATPPGPARGFRQLVADDCLLLTTPHDASLHFSCGVVARACPSSARLELRVPAPTACPSFEALRDTLLALRWTMDALTDRPLEYGEARVHPAAPAGWGVLVDAAARFVRAHTHGWPGTRRPTLNLTDSIPSYPSSLSCPT